MANITTPVQALIDTTADAGLSYYKETLQSVPPGTIANVYVNTVQEKITQINTAVNQIYTNANAAAGVSTQIQYNDRDFLAGDSGLTYDKNTYSLNVIGTIVTGAIRTNNLQHANGDSWMFGYANSNVSSFLPVYGGDISASSITSVQFIGDGSLLSNITGSTVTGTVDNANISVYANIANTVSVRAQPNITSVGTLTSLAVTGNVTSGNASFGNAVTANFFIGSGANLTNINGSNVIGVVANAEFSNTSGLANTVKTNAQPNITSVGILTRLEVGGNITASNADLGNFVIGNYFQGDGSYLENINGSNISGVVSSATSATTAGTVTTGEQPNITSVGVLSSLSITGNIVSSNANLGDSAIANFFIGDGSNLANIQSGNIVGNINQANYATIANSANSVAGSNVTGTVANATYAITSGTSYNVNGGNITGTVANATYAITSGTSYNVNGGNVSGTVANATYAVTSGTSYSVSGGNVFGQVSNSLVAGTVYTANQSNITNVGILTSLSVANAGTGNITADNANLGNLVEAKFFSGDGTNLSNIQAGNVIGTVANATSALTASTVVNSIQSNITSIGTLSSLIVSGTSDLGVVGNIAITGGSSGQYLRTNGSGSLSWSGPAINVSTLQALVAASTDFADFQSRIAML
jgi:hypothetical protein